jgi:small subunit ribosomal protein S1
MELDLVRVRDGDPFPVKRPGSIEGGKGELSSAEAPDVDELAESRRLHEEAAIVGRWVDAGDCIKVCAVFGTNADGIGASVPAEPANDVVRQADEQGTVHTPVGVLDRRILSHDRLACDDQPSSSGEGEATIRVVPDRTAFELTRTFVADVELEAVQVGVAPGQALRVGTPKDASGEVRDRRELDTGAPQVDDREALARGPARSAGVVGDPLADRRGPEAAVAHQVAGRSLATAAETDDTDAAVLAVREDQRAPQAPGRPALRSILLRLGPAAPVRDTLRRGRGRVVLAASQGVGECEAPEENHGDDDGEIARLQGAVAILIGRKMVSNETVTESDTKSDEGVWTQGPDGELIPDYDSTFPVINEGEVVRGKVVRVDKDEVLVDIGYKSEGVIPVAELSIRRSVNPADEVQVGDEIDALVMTKEDAEGRLILSKKRARFEMAWKRIEEAAESGEPVEGNVIEVVKGGLILDLGVRGFLPASLVDIRRVQDLDEFLAQTLRCKVIELNRSRNNVVLSRRAVLEEERKEMRQAILDRLSPGDVVTGTISNIVDFGAFVDLEGIDGLIHISELSWSHVNHPSELLDIGQEVQVKVLDIDRERQRISLGLKQTQSDPWQQVIESYEQGDVVEGRVTKVVTFGAFIEVVPGVEGLVHISELAQHHVENPREIVSPGETVRAKIIEMDAERRRLSLSLKRVDGEGQQNGDGSGAALGLSEEVFSEESEGVPPEEIQADEVAPEKQGPGNSEGGYPAPPEESSQEA